MAIIDKPFTIVRNPTALAVVLQVAAVLAHDRGGHAFLFMRDRRFRFYRLTIRSGEVRGAIAQVSSNFVFERGDGALKEILGLGQVERAAMRATCLIPAVVPEQAIVRPRTLGELAAGLMLGEGEEWAA